MDTSQHGWDEQCLEKPFRAGHGGLLQLEIPSPHESYI